MLWLLGKLSGPQNSRSRKKLVKATCACARLVLPLFEKKHPNDTRPREAIEIAEAHSNGKATLGEVKNAAAAAAAAAYDVSAAYAAYAAAHAAAYAAYYAAAAAYAAYAAAYDASAAAASAAAAAAYDARSKMLKQCADEVRKIYPKAPKL